MPLPAIRYKTALQCKAKSKHSQVRCLNPAAYGMSVCRFHGARKPQTILKDKDHPNYRHGNETLYARQKRRELSHELATLEEVGFTIGMLRGTRTRGRKAGGVEG
jgi:hypothetical protein